jgi:colicin import membrane protein
MDTTDNTSTLKGSLAYDASESAVLGTQATAALTSAREFVIDSPEMFDLAAEELRQIKGLQKMVEEKRTAITKPLNDVLRSVNDLFRSPAQWLIDAENAIKATMLTYTQEQERLAAVARLAAEAAAAEERKRAAEREAEQRRQAEASAAAAAEIETKAKAAAAAGHADEAVALQEQANEMTAQADNLAMAAESTAIVAQTLSAAPVVLAPRKVSGISTRTNYSAQVDDLMELVKAVAKGKAPIQALCADEKFLGQQARAFKAPGSLYPGVSIVAQRSMAARAA